jgi:hypothetical protein
VYTATYAPDRERVTKWDPVGGNHTSSYGLHVANGNRLFTPGLGHQEGARTKDGAM